MELFLAIDCFKKESELKLLLELLLKKDRNNNGQQRYFETF